MATIFSHKRVTIMAQPVVSKAQGIRNYLETFPEAPAADVVAALGRSGFRGVTPQDVYFQRSHMKRTKKGAAHLNRSDLVAKQESEQRISLDTLTKIIDLSKEVGGIDKLGKLVDILK